MPTTLTISPPAAPDSQPSSGLNSSLSSSTVGGSFYRQKSVRLSAHSDSVVSQLVRSHRRLHRTLSRDQRRMSVAPEMAFTFRRRVYALFDPSYEQPSKFSTLISYIVMIVLNLVNLIAVLVTCVQSLPEFYDQDNAVLSAIEATCIVLFTIDFVTRCVTCDSLISFGKDIFNWIDIVSIVPFYVELFWADNSGGALMVLRILRLFRAFRVVKTVMYNKSLTLVFIALRESIGALYLLVFLLSLCVVVFSSMLFLSESYDTQYFDDERELWLRNDGSKSPFQSIPHTCWWGIVTLATLGYGDDYPISLAGRCVAAATMYCAIFIVSLPIVEITYKFNKVMASYREEQQLQEMTSPRHGAGGGGGSAKLFQEDSGGDIDEIEMKNFTAFSDGHGGGGGGDGDVLVTPTFSAARSSAPFCRVHEGAILCNIKLRNRWIEVTYAGKIGRHHQFRYKALFMPLNATEEQALKDRLHLSASNATNIVNEASLLSGSTVSSTAATASEFATAVVCTVNRGVGQYSLRIRVKLDSLHFRSVVAANLRRDLGMYFPPSGGRDAISSDHCLAWSLAKVRVRIPHLPSRYTLATSEFASPGTEIGVLITAPTEKDLLLLKGLLPFLWMHFFGYCDKSSAQDQARRRSGTRNDSVVIDGVADVMVSTRVSVTLPSQNLVTAFGAPTAVMEVAGTSSSSSDDDDDDGGSGSGGHLSPHHTVRHTATIGNRSNLSNFSLHVRQETSSEPDNSVHSMNSTPRHFGQEMDGEGSSGGGSEASGGDNRDQKSMPFFNPFAPPN